MQNALGAFGAAYLGHLSDTAQVGTKRFFGRRWWLRGVVALGVDQKVVETGDQVLVVAIDMGVVG